MIVMYFITRYLKRLPDFDFETKWENHFLRYSRPYMVGLVVYYLIALTLITNVLLFGVESFFLGSMVFFLTMVVYGYYYLRSFLRLISYANNRLLNIKMGGPTDTFSKDNVVG